MKKLNIVLLLCLMSVFSCTKECNTHTMTPGRYTENCSCIDGGVNFHGECIPNHTTNFYGEYNGKCRLSFMVVLNYEENKRYSYQYSYDVWPEVVPKFGTIRVGEFINSNAFCEEDGENSISFVNYSYYVPDEKATDLEVVFKTVHRITNQVIDSETVILKKL